MLLPQGVSLGALCFVVYRSMLPSRLDAFERVQGADGTYGTSLAYGTAMDPSCDVMVAYKQNERFLAPDHGFPIRMIIPGHIGASASPSMSSKA